MNDNQVQIIVQEILNLARGVWKIADNTNQINENLKKIADTLEKKAGK
jgi:hypothetical protein